MATAAEPPKPRPFGAANRQRLLNQFLEDNDPAQSLPRWALIYRLLLWVDKTTGLGHCYESDKSQPGRPWYPRSLRFHDWLARSLIVEPAEVHWQIDWLFKKTADEYAAAVLRAHKARLLKAAGQWGPYDGRGFPQPGEDPIIVEIIRETLGNRLLEQPSAEEWRTLTQRIRESIAVENKRKNLLGEGFEDVLAAVINRVAGRGDFQAFARQPLHLVPGFANQRTGEKVNKVDLALVGSGLRRPSLITVKWSIRADREKQFPAEFTTYVQAQSGNSPFNYTLITNEFDPARLVRACESMAANNYLFTSVVHINCEAVREVYGQTPEPRMLEVLRFMDVGRLLGFDDWLSGLNTAGHTA